jgi:hypothetical protein
MQQSFDILVLIKPMPVSNSEFDKLKHRVKLLETPSSHLLDGSTLGNRSALTAGKLALAVASIGITILIASIGATHAIDTMIGGKFEGLDVRITKVENVVKVLASKQSDQTQALIRNLLSAAKTSDDPHAAAMEVGVAQSLLARLKVEKAASSPHFFESVSGYLQDFTKSSDSALGTAAFRTQRVLADYRSSLEPTPAIPLNTKSPEALAALPPSHGRIAFSTGTYMISKGLTLPPGIGFTGYGAAIDGSSIPRSTDMLTPKTDQLSQNRNEVEGLTLIGASQALDGIYWNHVTFLNELIKYRGGSLRLDHVRFVNCTFELPHHPESLKILDYAALKKDTLNVNNPTG